MGSRSQEAIRTLVRHVVFVTAHAEHAARAFDVAASDYLVKPVTQARFSAALDRIRRTLGEPGSRAHPVRRPARRRGGETSTT